MTLEFYWYPLNVKLWKQIRTHLQLTTSLCLESKSECFITCRFIGRAALYWPVGHARSGSPSVPWGIRSRRSTPRLRDSLWLPPSLHQCECKFFICWKSTCFHASSFKSANFIWRVQFYFSVLIFSDGAFYFGEYLSAGDDNVMRATADATRLGLTNFKPTAVFVVTWRRFSPSSATSDTQPAVSLLQQFKTFMVLRSGEKPTWPISVD